jgi:outer membrane protein assembly factor BamB
VPDAHRGVASWTVGQLALQRGAVVSAHAALVTRPGALRRLTRRPDLSSNQIGVRATALPVLVAAPLALGVASACAGSNGPQARRAVPAGGDWARFGYDAARHNVGPARTGITAANVGRLKRQQVRLPGTVDSSPIYLRGVVVRGRRHDVFLVTTSYGKTLALDAASGSVLWTFTPTGYASWAGSDTITNATPIADPGRRFVYAAAPDGRIHKLRLGSGAEVRSGGWPATITRLPAREKIGPALNYFRGLLLGATGGYLGDAPHYQGHVVAISAASGRIVHVWNALCSDRHALIEPRLCPESGAAIWARSGVVVDPASGRLLVATGDGRFDGKRYWGDSVLMLSHDAGRLVLSWTPKNYAALDSGDVDLGSTAPALLSSTLAVQSGKDGKLRLLRLRSLGGGIGRLGGELQTISAPGGNGVFSTIAVWRAKGAVRLFVATSSGTWAYVLRSGRLRVAWRRGEAGTSPVLAGGLLYVYNPDGGLNVLRPTTGALVARLPAGGGHWNSPIVTDGRIGLPEGDANDHRTSGVLDIFRLP